MALHISTRALPDRRLPLLAGALLAINVMLLLCWRWGPQTVEAEVRGAEVAATETRVRAAVRSLDLSQSERRVEGLGWYFDWDEAHTVAARLGRPIFLLTMLGELDGRC